MKSLLLILLLSLSGCVNLGGEQKPSVTYVLIDTRAATPATTLLPQILMVAPMRSSSFDDNDKLVFARATNSRGRYQWANWSERPSSRLDELLYNRLTQTRIYTQTVRDDNDVLAQQLLTTELLDFYHDARTAPGQIKARLRATLYDTQQHSVIAQQVFEQSREVSTFDAAGAATAFNLASTALIDDVVSWLTPTTTTQRQ
ncbi:MAG: ABC-type transport auxiliary lipoprotein family protein [Sulfuriferula sp.]